MTLSKRIKTIKASEKNPHLVTPKIEDFLLRVPDGVVWTEEAIEDFADLVKKTFGSNSVRKGRFGASGRGKCMRAQIWKFIGMPERTITDPQTLNLFNDGKWRHMRWQMMLLQSGVATHIEHSLPRLDKYRLTSSADALNADAKWLFELKGDRRMTRMLDIDGGVDEFHNMQIQTMLLMTGWDTCVYLVEDKSTQEWREIVVHRDPKIINQVKRELEELNEHVEQHTIPEPLPACKAKEGPYRNCPFAKPCIERWEKGNDYWPFNEGDWDS
jgi:hypothetical protein